MKQSVVVSIVLGVLVACAGTLQAANIFSLNFYGYGALAAEHHENVTLEEGQSAGVGDWNTTGWENYLVPWDPPSPRDPVTLTSTMGDTATFTLITCRNGGPYLWGVPRTTLLGDANADLMDGHVNSTLDAGEIFDMEVTDIPFAVYDVIIYLGANQAQFGDGTGKLVFNGGDEQDFTLTSGEFAAFTEIVDATTPGNYMVFKGVTGSSFSVQTWGLGNNGFNHIGPTGFQIAPSAAGMQITAIAPDVDPAKFSMSWDSQAGKVYDILGTADPLADPQVWTPLVSDIAATPPENTEAFTKPVGAFTTFAVLEKPIPPIFSDDFESDLGWTVGVDAGTDTDWERGTPSVIGPAAANSPVTCYGTNIDAAYGTDVNITLRSPAIDLSAATAATLSFQQFYDIEAGFDAGAVRVLKSSDLTQLGTDIVNPVDGTVTEWTEFTGALPTEALGETVILEFRFTSDGFAPSAQAGWYIDDVSVTVE